jgi:hypothetical protein
MTILMWVHLAGGSLAILSGAVAVAARKGGPLHIRAGTWFAASMLVLGVTATILARLKAEPESGLGGILTCYFIATSWVAARRHDGTSGKFEIIACASALGAAALVAWGGLMGDATTPVGRGPVFATAAVCLLAGLLDLNVILRRKLSPTQRISRHLWRMLVAFFIATGSFFIGQQDVLPAALRGSPLLFVLGFAPLGLMLFWLVRIRVSKRFARSAPAGLISMGHPLAP